SLIKKQHLPEAALPFALAAASVCFLIGFFTALRRYWTVAGTATSKISSASQGFVELAGRIQSRSVDIRLPHSGLPCVWYSYTIERSSRTQKWHEKSWDFDHSEQSAWPVCVADESGREVFILPDRMNQLSIPSVVNIESKAFGLTTRYRHTERYLTAGDRVFLNGTLTTCNSTGLSAAATLLGNLKDKEAMRELQKSLLAMSEQSTSRDSGTNQPAGLINVLTPCKMRGGLLAYGNEAEVLKKQKQILLIKTGLSALFAASIFIQ
ncbi:MAG: hypothetical protein R3194_05935, partial [Limnobacter sp.]|nr:hypothetical protein [Limnobacter sp.]